jgi:peptidoglycan hydrolase CwlO-like protein
MKRKYKITGCAKFFFVLIILAPLAYIGASYYNGENGIQNAKEFLGIGKDGGSDTKENQSDVYDLQSKISKLEKEVNYLENENDRLENELKKCQETREE